MASAHNRSAKSADAQSRYTQALAIDPGYARANHDLGLLASRLGRNDKAAEMLAKAVALEPEEPLFHSSLGTALEQMGKLDEAVVHYRRALVIKPDYIHIHYNLGNALKGQGKLDEAEASYRRALALMPDYAEAHSNLGNVLRAQGRLDEAIAAHRQALALRPDAAAAHANLGAALKGQGKLDEAAAAYRRALALKPNSSETLNNLGVVLSAGGKLDEAAASFSAAVSFKPDFAEAHCNLGATLGDLGRLEEAVACYRQALRLKPDYATALSNLGNALRDQDKFDEAAELIKRALALKPLSAPAHNNLGLVFKAQGKLDDATASFKQALALDPRLAQAHNNLGGVFLDQERLDEAATCCLRALALKPDYAEAHNNLGLVFKGQLKLLEATESHKQALALKPDLTLAHNNLGVVFLEQGRIAEALEAYQRALALKPGYTDAHSNYLMTQHYDGRTTNAGLLAAARRFGASLSGNASAREFLNDRSPERRLRIGYVSADFLRHPVGYLLARVFESHDPTAVEIFCYANRAKTDDLTARLQGKANCWRSIVGMSDADAAALIRADGVDILIDLAGHTGRNRLPMFARRPAPIQATWLGYFGTTGLAAMDYLLMDEWAVPIGEERWYSEALVRLPHGRFCYAPPDYAPLPVDPPALRRGYVTFGSFNNIAKIGPDVVRLWADVLRTTPDSRLLLKWRSLDDADARRRLSEAFNDAGIAADRLVFRGFSPHQEMLAQYGEIDIALDPFPFGGGVTSCEALWMGAPVVTWPGDRPASRQTIGFLSHVGLDDCVARSADEYVRCASTLAADPNRLSELRRSLRSRMAATPLCEGGLFTPTLEAAFRRMWRRWCAGEPVAPFDLQQSDAAA